MLYHNFFSSSTWWLMPILLVVHRLSIYGLVCHCFNWFLTFNPHDCFLASLRCLIDLRSGIKDTMSWVWGIKLRWPVDASFLATSKISCALICDFFLHQMISAISTRFLDSVHVFVKALRGVCFHEASETRASLNSLIFETGKIATTLITIQSFVNIFC